MESRRAPIGTVGALSLVALGWFDSECEQCSAARAALENVSVGSDGAALAEPPELDDVHAVATNRDDDPIYVPVVEVDLGTAADPDRDAAYRIAAAVVDALHSALAGDHVRQYDLVFSYGERSWFSTTEQRRISVTPDLAEQLDREPSFGAAELQNAIERADDGDDEIPPVDWGEPLSHSYYHGSSDDSIAAMGGAGVF